MACPSVQCKAAALRRRCCLGVTPTAEAWPAAKAADLDAGGLEGIAVLRTDRHHLGADGDIAQLPIDLLAHGAFGSELHFHGLAIAGCQRDRIARDLTHSAGRPTTPKAATSLPATLAALTSSLSTALASATLAEEPLRCLRPIQRGRPPTDDLPTVKAGAGHYQQRDNPDNSFS